MKYFKIMTLVGFIFGTILQQAASQIALETMQDSAILNQKYQEIKKAHDTIRNNLSSNYQSLFDEIFDRSMEEKQLQTWYDVFRQAKNSEKFLSNPAIAGLANTPVSIINLHKQISQFLNDTLSLATEVQLFILTDYVKKQADSCETPNTLEELATELTKLKKTSELNKMGLS